MRIYLVVPILLVPAAALAGMDGVSYATKNFELVKRVSTHRSVIYPDVQPSRQALDRQEGEVRTGLVHLGSKLDGLMRELRSPETPYPLLSNTVLDYAYLRPPEQSLENGRMYIMYIGELYWPFPAPLLADMLRIRVVHSFPQPMKDLLTTVLVRWGRDNIDAPSQHSPAMRREMIDDWIDELQSPEILRAQWRHDRVAKNLLLADLAAADIESLKSLAGAKDVRVRVAALKILGTSGRVSDPTFFAGLLKDPQIEVQHTAFWGLVFMPGGEALPYIQAYEGRAHVIAARLKEKRASVGEELVARELASFDQIIASITGKAAVAATPYMAELSEAELLLGRVKAAAGSGTVKEPAPKKDEKPASPPEEKSVEPTEETPPTKEAPAFPE